VQAKFLFLFCSFWSGDQFIKSVHYTHTTKEDKNGIGQPTYEKVNEELILDNPLHVILNKSKLAYMIYVILIANKELIKKRLSCENCRAHWFTSAP
jgi:hypothetical protein